MTPVSTTTAYWGASQNQLTWNRARNNWRGRNSGAHYGKWAVNVSKGPHLGRGNKSRDKIGVSLRPWRVVEPWNLSSLPTPTWLLKIFLYIFFKKNTKQVKKKLNNSDKFKIHNRYDAPSNIFFNCFFFF